MKKIFLFFILLFCSLFISQKTFAQQLPQDQLVLQTFFKGTVTEIIKEGEVTIGNQRNAFQDIKVKVIEGKDTGKIITIKQGGQFNLTPQQRVVQDQEVLLTTYTGADGKATYSIYESYRLNTLLWIVLAFIVLTIVIAGKKGLGAIVGLVISLSVIILFIIPQILYGTDPLLISIIGSLIILGTTTYLAHGFSKQTSIAVISTFISLAISALLSYLFVQAAHLTGLGSEDAVTLQMSQFKFNFQGLLLGGVIIGTLGALNDVTTTQVATVFSLHKSNPKFSLLSLAEEGFLIGREHIVSLVNTLVLAYAGATLTIFIFFNLNPLHLPYWVILNSESTAEEIIRTIGGSFGLMLAVPISTFLGAYFAARRTNHDE